jgi:hypothetical protein
MAALDWSQCPAVESVPGRLSGGGFVLQAPSGLTTRCRLPTCSTGKETTSGIWRYKIFTARAASNAMVAREILACTIIKTFAQRESTGTSVGENAVLVLKARNK